MTKPIELSLEELYAALWAERDAQNAEQRRLGALRNAEAVEYKAALRKLGACPLPSANGDRSSIDAYRQRYEAIEGPWQARSEFLEVSASQASIRASELTSQIDELWPKVRLARLNAIDAVGSGSVVELAVALDEVQRRHTEMVARAAALPARRRSAIEAGDVVAARAASADAIGLPVELAVLAAQVNAADVALTRAQLAESALADDEAQGALRAADEALAVAQCERNNALDRARVAGSRRSALREQLTRLEKQTATLAAAS